MYQCLTILRYLPFRPGVTFDDPSTSDGKLWNSALKQVSQTQGWSELHWGSRVAAEDVVDLLISKSYKPCIGADERTHPKRGSQPGRAMPLYEIS